MIELAEKGNIKTTVIPLKPLHEVRIIKGTLNEILNQSCDDYVSVILTETPQQTDISARIIEAFPNLLEIRYSFKDSAYNDIIHKPETTTAKSIFELCEYFAKDLNDDEKNILRDIINTVQEDNEIWNQLN